ncbi:MAG: hypothetical protein AAGH88_14190 [Planctomycetota bacterium]
MPGHTGCGTLPAEAPTRAIDLDPYPIVSDQYHQIITTVTRGPTMLRMTYPLLALMSLITLTGCGGSSPDLPTKVFTDDIFALHWVDVGKLTPEEGIDMFKSLSGDMDDDQAKARLLASAEADGVEASYQERWEAFTEAGGLGFLTVYSAKTKEEGSGDNKRKVLEEVQYILVYVKKDTSAEALEKALADFAKQDNNEKIKFESVDGSDGRWFWLTRENRPDDAPKLPTDGSEENAKAFEKLMGEAADAAVVAVLRPNTAIKDMLKQDQENLDDDASEEAKDRLKNALALESAVMGVAAGSSPSVNSVYVYSDKERAASFADENNEDLAAARRSLKRALARNDDPPHPSYVDDMVESMALDASGKKVTLELSSDAIHSAYILDVMTGGGGAIAPGPSPIAGQGSFRPDASPFTAYSLSFSDN